MLLYVGNKLIFYGLWDVLKTDVHVADRYLPWKRVTSLMKGLDFSRGVLCFVIYFLQEVCPPHAVYLTHI